MTYTAYFFIDSIYLVGSIDTGNKLTHLAGFDPVRREWRVPCGIIPGIHEGHVTYAPHLPLCRICSRFTRDPSPIPRTHHR